MHLIRTLLILLIIRRGDALKLRHKRKYNRENDSILREGQNNSKPKGQTRKSPIFAQASELKEENRDREKIPSEHTSSFLNSFRKILNDNFIFHPPRDLWQGALNAISNFNRAYWSSIWQFLDAGWNGYSTNGIFGLVGGSCYGLAQGALLATGGLAAGLYQLLYGFTNTPLAIHESFRGKLWEDGKWKVYSLDEEDWSLDQQLGLSEVKQRRPRQLRQRSMKRVKDMEYYNLLKIRTDASQSEIKQAYYREALNIHPDKNNQDDKANEKFHELSLAYRILANEETRDIYDSMGKCFVEQQQSPGMSQVVDSYTFFAVLFGSQEVEPYVGQLKVASMVDSFLQFNDDADETLNKQSLNQKRRVVDIALHLRARVSNFVNGVQSESEFRVSSRLEAADIAVGDFGDSFLISIGRSLMMESKKFVGRHTSVLGLHGASATLHAATSEVRETYQTTVALIQSIASSIRPILEAVATESDREQDSAKDCADGGKSAGENTVLLEKLERSIPKALRLVWQLNDRDIRQTLKLAAEKVFQDDAPQDIKLARARGLEILGGEFFDMGRRTMRKDRWRDAESLKRSMEAAFEAAAAETEDIIVK
jgi:curved DNA-binding protein CbpA